MYFFIKSSSDQVRQECIRLRMIGANRNLTLIAKSIGFQLMTDTILTVT